MAHDQTRINWTDPSIQALLDALGVEIVDGMVKAPFELGPGAGSIQIAAIGWATVELDRAAAVLGEELGATFTTAVRDALLGASVRRSTGKEPQVLLLEPDTEGRLAGALAKHGEGPSVLYLSVEDLAGLPGTLSIRAGNGPLGPARLILGGAPWGPFTILVGPPGPPGPLGPSPEDADRVPSEP